MEFPSLGQNCSHSLCNQLDFLPMKCDSCSKIFCKNHFRYEQHECEGENRKDIQVPTCPLCLAPVPGKRGEALDVAVSAHIDDDCEADPAIQRRNKIFVNKCKYKGCKVKEMVPLICSECSLNFCFKHRHGADHKCIGKIAAIKKRSEEAAVARLKAKETARISQKSEVPKTNTNRNFLSEIQGSMSEDEALAHALALSLQNESSDSRNNTSRRNMGLSQNQQRVGGEQNNGRCIVS